MNCPLLGTMRTLDKVEPRFAKCTEEACAWWLLDEKKCAITVIAKSEVFRKPKW